MESESLIPLAFSVNGGIGRKTIIFCGRIAEKPDREEERIIFSDDGFVKEEIFVLGNAINNKG